MRTNIEIDDTLLDRAMAVTGADTKKGAIESAMRMTVQLHKQAQAVQQLWGLGWDGDLEALRENEHQDWDAAWNDAEPGKNKSVA